MAAAVVFKGASMWGRDRAKIFHVTPDDTTGFVETGLRYVKLVTARQIGPAEGTANNTFQVAPNTTTASVAKNGHIYFTNVAADDVYCVLVVGKGG